MRIFRVPFVLFAYPDEQGRMPSDGHFVVDVGVVAVDERARKVYVFEQEDFDGQGQAMPVISLSLREVTKVQFRTIQSENRNYRGGRIRFVGKCNSAGPNYTFGKLTMKTSIKVKEQRWPRQFSDKGLHYLPQERESAREGGSRGGGLKSGGL